MALRRAEGIDARCGGGDGVVNRSRLPVFLAVSVCLALAPFVAMPASAEDNFYAGKTIDMLIGFSAGGGYDLYGRTLARYLGRHIPGNPQIVPQDMPGAGSLKLA